MPAAVAPSATVQAPVAPKQQSSETAPLCANCGNITQRAGSCYVCTTCGSTSGCS
jgi:ribonucleoside-diphosphate reductase alpha chain